MVKQIKANKMINSKIPKRQIKFNLKPTKLIIILLLTICLIFILNPSIYANSCLQAISVWAFNVLPVLFPFFIFTKLIISLIEPKQTKLDKLFFKLYHTPATSSTIYLLSILSGYPMGAKLICNMFERGLCNQQDAKRMLSFCSVSGPMFMIGTVGVSIFKSYSAGLIILIANLLASLINGLFYRGKTQNFENTTQKQIFKASSSALADSVYDALTSILLVGAYMVLAFLLIDLLNAHLFALIGKFFNKLFRIDSNIIKAISNGGIEITRGIIELNNCTLSIREKVIFASGLIGFGGISILLQSITFLKKLNIKAKYMFMQKLTQGIIATLIAIPLSFMLH